MFRATLPAICGALIILPQLAFGAQSDPSKLCIDVSVPRAAVAANDGRWSELTPDQWQFLRGIYAMNPQTPPGLPYGNKAALAQTNGNAGGLVFFIDGDKACTPMAVPPELLAMIQDVASGKVNHQGVGL